MLTTRFAPSPTGHLHLGHALSARFAVDLATALGGRALLRIDDLDQTRARDHYRADLEEDLAWLGLRFDGPVRVESDHFDAYAEALERLRGMGVLYPCICTRKEIQAEIEASGAAPHGADGPLYPGLCRGRQAQQIADHVAAGGPVAWRLDAAAAIDRTGPLTWWDALAGRQSVDVAVFGDVVLGRKDIGSSYHLAVVVDDAATGVSHVTRGADLFDSTAIHRLLIALLDLPVPMWVHHPLVTDPTGRRLAKRDGARSLRQLRSEGWTPGAIWRHPGVPDLGPLIDQAVQSVSGQ